MSNRRALFVFSAVFLIALVLLFPLGLALRWFEVDKAGLTARAAGGDIWTGQLADARVGPVTLGFARVGLRPLPLLVGRAELGADTEIGFGRLVAGATAQGIDGVTAKLPLAAAFAPLPLETLDLADASVSFHGDVCDHATGRARAVFAGSVAGLSLPAGLSGTMKCEGNELVLPLVSQSAMERLTIRLKADGRWTGLLGVKAGDPALAAKLAAAGFQAVGNDYVLRLSGIL